ncbi:MAG TPA: penicillin-binding protein 2, partial [Erythrobacter sp.]|nr:penicillin-binding protein 2 [Erythrobacter sp.]
MNTLSASAAISTGRGQLVTFRRQSLATARLRVLWIALIFALVAAAALIRIAYLGAVDQGPVRTSLEEALLPLRGEITDRNGVPLARAFPAY